VRSEVGQASDGTVCIGEDGWKKKIRISSQDKEPIRDQKDNVLAFSIDTASFLGRKAERRGRAYLPLPQENEVQDSDG